jgi:hypothetical protein
MIKGLITVAILATVSNMGYAADIHPQVKQLEPVQMILVEQAAKETQIAGLPIVKFAAPYDMQIAGLPIVKFAAPYDMQIAGLPIVKFAAPYDTQIAGLPIVKFITTQATV